MEPSSSYGSEGRHRRRVDGKEIVPEDRSDRSDGSRIIFDPCDCSIMPIAGPFSGAVATGLVVGVAAFVVLYLGVSQRRRTVSRST